MPKGNSSKMNGCVCNMPTDRIGIKCISLSQPVDCNGIVIVKVRHIAIKYFSNELAGQSGS